jgi:tRNA dimethylallyltransferase
MKEKVKIVALCGPTGVGKTQVSLEIATRFSGEIVNFDSQQFYRELVIGTAKPLPEERKGIPHHLFEELSLLEEMNASRFVELADEKVSEIRLRGRLPLLVGGTGLYLRAFEYGLFQVKIDPEIRKELKKRAEDELPALYEELKRHDPEYAQKIHPKDRVRIVRALEVILSTGITFSEFHRQSPFFKEKRYPLLKIGLYLPREELYAKINSRAERMIEKGWLREVEALYLRYGATIFDKIKAIGYRELFQVLCGELSLDSAIKIIQRETRHYAKRQLTWFKREKDLEWFKPSDISSITRRIEEYLETP